MTNSTKVKCLNCIMAWLDLLEDSEKQAHYSAHERVIWNPLAALHHDADLFGWTSFQFLKLIQFLIKIKLNDRTVFQFVFTFRVGVRCLSLFSVKSISVTMLNNPKQCCVTGEAVYLGVLGSNLCYNLSSICRLILFFAAFFSPSWKLTFSLVSAIELFSNSNSSL